jgi:RNA polymerase sigma-70 factor (ECF subfamily)
MVQAAGRSASPRAREALSALCVSYWYPLYAYIRRRGYGSDDASDLTQEFFATLLEKGYLSAAQRKRGRFRSFLLAACKHFLSKERDRRQAQKRGGGRRRLPLDFAEGENRYLREPAHDLTAERVYERGWALATLDCVIARLADEFARLGKETLFERLKTTLTGEPSAPSYSQAALDMGMSEGAVKVAAHRLRRRFRELLRQEIAQTVASPDEINDEIRDLFAAVASPEQKTL